MGEGIEFLVVSRCGHEVKWDKNRLADIVVGKVGDDVGQCWGDAAESCEADPQIGARLPEGGGNQAESVGNRGLVGATGYKHDRWLDTVFMQLAMNGGKHSAPDPESIPQRMFRGAP